jgi:hypothetical protein
MRTTQRDQTGTVSFGAFVVDAAGGSGVANGIRFSYTRSSTGVYFVLFPVALVPLTANITAFQGAYVGAADTFAPGSFRVVMALSGAVANTSFFFSCVARDQRT